MVETIRRNLEHDLRQMSLSIDEQNGAGASIIDAGSGNAKDDGMVDHADGGPIADGNDGAADDVGTKGPEPQHLPTKGPVPAPIDFENYCPPRKSPQVASDEREANEVAIDAGEPSNEGVKPPITAPINFNSESGGPPRHALMVKRNDDALTESVDAKVNQSSDKLAEGTNRLRG